MNRISLRLPVWALPCLVLLSAGLSANANAGEYSKSYSVSGRADVRIQADDSSVNVTSTDTNQVDFRVTYEERSVGLRIGSKLKIDSQQNGDQVELNVLMSPGFALGFNMMRIRTEVHMPKNADLRLETHDGSVEVTSVNGNIIVRTSDGGIKASKLSGTIDLNTGDGGITTDTLKGVFKLHTGDGAINGADLDGQCDVSSGDGAIHLAGRFDSLDIKTGDGSVVASVAAGSKMTSTWNIRTGDGGIELTLPKDFQANLDASTNDGHIGLAIPVVVQGEIDKKKLRGTLNGGGPSLVIHSGDGSIRLNGV